MTDYLQPILKVNNMQRSKEPKNYILFYIQNKMEAMTKP